MSLAALHDLDLDVKPGDPDLTPTWISFLSFYWC